MGRPKLVLPIAGATVIARVIDAFRTAGVSPVIVVAPPSEIEGAQQLAFEAEARGAVVVRLDRPTPDMRASLEFGLASLRRDFAEPDAVLIAPGDSPGLSSNVILKLMDHFLVHHSIVAPLRAGKRGHPLLLPWAEALKIVDLPEGVGVNALLAQRADEVLELEIDDDGAFEDLDTPEDYQKWTEGEISPL